MGFSISRPGLISDQFITMGIHDFQDAVQWVQRLPYGRNSDRGDYTLVMKEHKGTCSTKHALLRQLAKEQGMENVQLITGIYQMDRNNTPGIGNVLEVHGLEYIPEAHCYLSVDGTRMDVTTPGSRFSRLEQDIIRETVIAPEQIGSFKVGMHQEYLKEWVKGISKLTFEDVWAIREECIRRLEGK